MILMKYNSYPDFQEITIIMEDLMLGGDWLMCSTVLFIIQLQEVGFFIRGDGICIVVFWHFPIFILN
jgi:hypothetical protein